MSPPGGVMIQVEQRIAEFVVGTETNEVPEAAIEAARRSIFDCVGCMLAASAQPHGQKIIQFARQEGAPGQSTIFGSDQKTSRSMAALANATLAHGLDYDDGRTASGHACGVFFPTALAVGEPLGVSGRELLTAYAIGLEVITHIADACHFEEKEAGFHLTSLMGTMGATATAARLMGLSQEQTVMALGIAGSMGTGIIQNFGTYTKPLHSGLASKNAVIAARLAADGWTASDNILGGLVGWSAAYMKNYDYEAMARDLGGPWRTAARTPLIKQYPCCGMSHGPLDSLLRLMAEHGFTHRDVEQLEVRATYDSLVMMFPEPASGFQGKFSLSYTLATALIDGKLDIDSFTDEKLARPEYAETVAKIKVGLTSKWETGTRETSRRVRRDDALPLIVRLKDGRTLSRSAGRVDGLQTPEEIMTKFRGNASRALSPDDVEATLDGWWRLDELSDIREATRTVGSTVMV